jgi:peroxiredoxin
VVVWGIASGETQGALEDFRDQMGLTYPILMDTDGSVNEMYAQYFAFESAAYPQDWVIGTDGVIIYRNNGFELDAMITAIESQL